MSDESQRSDWKAILIPYSDIAAQGTGTIQYRLSERTIGMLLSQTEYLHWSSRWLSDSIDGFTPTELENIEDWASTAEHQLMESTVDAPYWDDADSADDTALASEQHWYGEAHSPTFTENLAIWGITAFIAYSGNIGGAIQFFTFAPTFVLAWKKSGIGGAIRVFVDGIDKGLIDTYDPAGGIIEAIFTGDPEEETHQIIEMLESKPEGSPEFDVNDPETANMVVIRKRLTELEANMVTNIRQNAASGQLEMFRAGAWENVPTANNVREDGTVAMSGLLTINRTATGTTRMAGLNLVRRGGTPGLAYGMSVDLSAEKVGGTAGQARTQARILSEWLDANDSSRRGGLDFIISHFTAGASALKLGVNAAGAPLFGALGAAAVARQVITGSRNANPALASLLSALETIGLITDSSTAGTLPITSATAHGLPAGDPPTAVITGTVLDLGIPAGAAGADGADGADGAPGAPATTPVTELDPHGSIGSGDCVEYDLILDGNGQVILPTVLQAGYTIEITELTGAATDQLIDVETPFLPDLFPEWYCPTGEPYFLGGCVGAGHTDGTDPLPSANHMALIVSVNGVLFDASLASVLEIGQDVNDVLVVFQLNDSDLSDNAGQIKFHVQICNPGGCFTTDFAVGDGGYQVQGAYGTYDPGFGWRQQDNLSNGYQVAVELVFYEPLPDPITQFQLLTGGTSGLRSTSVQLFDEDDVQLYAASSNGFAQATGISIPNVKKIVLGTSNIYTWGPDAYLSSFELCTG